MVVKTLKEWFVENNMDISAEQLKMFNKYALILDNWNKMINLTAIKDPRDVAIRHFIDSVCLLKYENIDEGAKIIDIGTGAGFPGVPLKIMRQDLELTLLDSLNKRLIFLSDVLKNLELEATLIHSRAEDKARDTDYRDSYDVVVSRALADLPSLCEYCLPYVKCGGYFYALKGPYGDKELAASENAIATLGAEFIDITSFSLPDESKRSIIKIKKILPTPDEYPRNQKKILRYPL